MKPRQLLMYAKTIRQRVRRNALILAYHRVVSLVADPQLLCVSLRNFSEQMESLRRLGNPIPLTQLVRDLRDRRLPRRSIVVTFDDGYADNLHNAKPILERADVPATVFVTAGFVGHHGEFWWDELQRVLLQPGRLPDVLELRVNELSLDWNLGSSARYTEKDYQKDEGWNVEQAQPPTERHALYLALHRMIRPLPDNKRRSVIERLQTWAGSGANARDTHRPMSKVELQKLVAGNLVDVGAHTVTHPLLSALPAAAQQSEIAESKSSLEDILNRPVRTFAYPFGGLSDYTPATVTAVQEAGFECGCSNYPGLVRQHTDSFQLPRALVRNWDGDEFARRLRGWLYGG